MTVDLDRTPYRPYVELLQELRTSPEFRSLVDFCETKEARRGTFDAHETERLRLAHILQVHGVAEDVELLRFLLDQEITARQSDSFQGAGDALRILSLLLLEHGGGHPDDTWRFWLAKTANFDTFAGGYDIEFVLCQLSPEEVVHLVRQRAPDKLHLLDRYDLADIHRGIEAWRSRLRSKIFPASLADFKPAHEEVWAEVFGDAAEEERLALASATTAEDRARVFQRFERFDDALVQWRAAAEEATSSWDRSARLRGAVQAAAKVPVATLTEAEQLDALRDDIDNWCGLGLGRQCTEAVYELAAAIDDDDIGPRLWAMAERWRSELDSFMLVGLRAGRNAAEKWGSAEDVARLDAAVRAEHERIYGAS